MAISPLPIIAFILVLFSKRSRSNSWAFLAGWVLALSTQGVIVILLGDISEVTESSGFTRGAAIFFLIIGISFLFFAYMQWSKRPGQDEEPRMPKWMELIDDFSAGKSLVAGFLLVVLNPKNLPLAVTASIAITSSCVGGAEQGAALAIFVIISSITIIVPLVTYLVAGERAERVLESWKAWLSANSATVLALLFLVFGVLLIGNGIKDL